MLRYMEIVTFHTSFFFKQLGILGFFGLRITSTIEFGELKTFIYYCYVSIL